MYQQQTGLGRLTLLRNGAAWPQFALAAIGTGLAAFAIQALPSAAATPVPASSAAVDTNPRRLTPPPAPVFTEPTDAAVELTVPLSGTEQLDRLLQQAGAARPDSLTAARLVREALPAGLAKNTDVRILLGDGNGKSGRRLERLSFKPGTAFRITIGRTATGELKLVRDALNVDAKPQKFTGRAGDDLFWSLRSAGVPAASAAEFIDAVSGRVDIRSLPADSPFELVVDHLRLENGESSPGPLLFAALGGPGANSIMLVRWTSGGRTGWFDPRHPERRATGLAKPVHGPLSSRFGERIHPILRFARFHSGVDFSARTGTPVVAAADGVVSTAGWAGGYGLQVRLSHADGVATSYAHLSSIAVTPGEPVRRGEIVGSVGSSGLSTGAHLHFEVRRNGRPLDPLGFSFAPPPLTRFEIAALRARAEQLRGA